MPKMRSTNFFTLLEVVIALAIFTMGLVGALTLVASAAKRVDSSVKRWERQHALAQAAEFFILKGFEDASIPDEYFPNGDYRIKLELAEPEGLPEDDNAEIEDGKWQLKRVVLTLCDETGRDIDGLEFDRLIYDDSK